MPTAHPTAPTAHPTAEVATAAPAVAATATAPASRPCRRAHQREREDDDQGYARAMGPGGRRHEPRVYLRCSHHDRCSFPTMGCSRRASAPWARRTACGRRALPIKARFEAALPLAAECRTTYRHVRRNVGTDHFEATCDVLWDPKTHQYDKDAQYG